VRLAGIALGVGDLAEASAAYTVLLGAPPLMRPGRPPRFQLDHGAVELAADAPGAHTLLFLAERADEHAPEGMLPGLAVRLEPEAGAPAEAPFAPVTAIDHVVVQSPDPDRAIALWRDRIGLRLALDRTFPERGLRLVFFRSGGLTLEIAAPHPPPAERAEADRIHGVSYRVADLAAHRERLLAAGLDVSPIRTGMRPGTIVATVRSGTAGVPTLLLEVQQGG
jgi:catechol 2,3-dioxygenase-like lactoylglutathione lyase family enzyme